MSTFFLFSFPACYDSPFVVISVCANCLRDLKPVNDLVKSMGINRVRFAQLNFARLE